MRIKNFLIFKVLSILLFHTLTYAEVSLKPQPLPKCRTFLITEIGYTYQVSSVPEGLTERRHHFISNLGLMVNLSKKYAIGVTNFAGMESGSQFRWGIKARGRRWFNNNTSLDLSLGFNFLDTRSTYKIPQFSGELSFNIRDLFNLVILFEVTKYDITHWYWDTGYVRYAGTDLGLYTGCKLGKTHGLIANIGYAIAAAVIGALWLFGGEE